MVFPHRSRIVEPSPLTGFGEFLDQAIRAQLLGLQLERQAREDVTRRTLREAQLEALGAATEERRAKVRESSEQALRLRDIQGLIRRQGTTVEPGLAPVPEEPVEFGTPPRIAISPETPKGPLKSA